MKRIPIHFFAEDLDFTIKKKAHLRNWINEVIEKENHSLKEINYIFCSDRYLLDVNIQYLNHNTYTDVITFDTSEKKKLISGDIFISIDRIKENAEIFHSDFLVELRRVMIHGALHLLGYPDKTKAEKATIRAKEDDYLFLYTSKM